MCDLDERIDIAKQNNAELEQLLTDYLPFIKKQILNMSNLGLDYDDCLSIGKITFINAIKQYDKNMGNFFSFSATCIKNRIIDESRKERKKYGKVISLSDDSNENNTKSMIDKVSFLEYNKELEKQALALEIDELSKELENFNIKLHELHKICPKQTKSREQCIKIAKEIVKNDEMKHTLFKFNKIPQSELANIFKISYKTLEKHRKYIVTIAVLLAGDYPNIKTFIPEYREVR